MVEWGLEPTKVAKDAGMIEWGLEPTKGAKDAGIQSVMAASTDEL